jgi:arsenate reductase-like glutaredoxin family protein
MCPLSNTSRSDSYGETPGEAGSVAAAFAGKDYYQELIGKANTVPITKLFKDYGIRLDSHNKKTTCPFKSHKGGRERSGSFYYYPETNSFFCFGCKIGGQYAHGCELVMHMDGCTKVQAAYKILQQYESDVDEDNIYDPEDFEERLKIMMDFSNTVREFYQTYPTEEAGVYVEAACKKFDALNLRKKPHNNEALQRIVEQLKKYIALYKP